MTFRPYLAVCAIALLAAGSPIVPESSATTIPLQSVGTAKVNDLNTIVENVIEMGRVLCSSGPVALGANWALDVTVPRSSTGQATFSLEVINNLGVVVASASRTENVPSGADSIHRSGSLALPALPATTASYQVAVKSTYQSPTIPLRQSVEDFGLHVTCNPFVGIPVPPTVDGIECDPDAAGGMGYDLWLQSGLTHPIGQDQAFQANMISGEYCRLMNSLYNTFGSPLCDYTGYCTCATQMILPVAGVDTDGDGVPDSMDADKDCDHLANDLEQEVQGPFDDLIKNNPYDMSPFLTTTNLAVVLGISGLEVAADFDDYKVGLADPFAANIRIGYTNSGATDIADLELPGFRYANGDHPENVGSSATYATHPAGVDDGFGDLGGWSTKMDYSFTLPKNYNDHNYTWRNGGYTGIPRLDFSLQIYDDDAGGSSLADEELLLSLNSNDLDLMQLAELVAGALTPDSVSPAGTVTPHIQIAVSASPCALEWASRVAQGEDTITLTDIQSVLSYVGPSC